MASKLKEGIGRFFGAVDLKDGDAVFKMKGVKRIVKIGFVLGYIGVNLLSYSLVHFGLVQPPSHNFIIPTALSANRLVFSTFLLTAFYFMFDAETIREWNDKYRLNYVYDEEKHKDMVEKEWD